MPTDPRGLRGDAPLLDAWLRFRIEQPDQFLDPSNSLIQCATHGALFLIENGECVAGPCAGQSLTAIECREDTQGVWIDV